MTPILGAALTLVLATGTVGACAIVRSDISDAPPGLAIAISLVPPLAVTGSAVLLGYRIRPSARVSGYGVGRLCGAP